MGRSGVGYDPLRGQWFVWYLTATDPRTGEPWLIKCYRKNRIAAARKLSTLLRHGIATS